MKKLFWILAFMGIFTEAQIINDSIEIDTTEVVTTNTKDIQAASYTNTQKYILADIKISGNTKFTRNQIVRFTNLILNEEIEIPGSKINNAVKKLWRQNIFSDVDIYVEKVEGNKIFLRIHLVGLPELANLEFTGPKKSHKEDFIKSLKLDPGVKITDNLINQTRNEIRGFYRGKGYPDTKVEIKQTKIDTAEGKENLAINVDRGNRVKIKNIVFRGNKELPNKKLRKAMKDTKRRSINIFKSSKLIPEKYNADLKKVVDTYKSVGFRDAKIISDTIKRVDDRNFQIEITVEEGRPYYLGEVTFNGNSVFTTEQLQRVFGFKKGDRYDAIGINKKISGSEKDDDLATLYMDRGYLFSQLIPIEKNVKNDTIDLEILIQEGEPATLNNVTFKGNVTTHDHIIARELRTKPGDLFSKSEIKRTLMELASMAFFEPQEISPDIQPNYENNTVDIEWKLAEKSSSQVELQGGYGAGTFLGTLGLSFMNFSARNIFNPKAWKPIPQGDGQQLSIRAQAGRGFQNYSISFTEPWIGGRRPTALSTSFYYSRYSYYDNFGQESRLNIFGATVGLSKLLTWPDDYFRLTQSVSFQKYDFNNYALTVGNLNYENGSSYNLNYTLGFTRLSAGPDPIFPTEGSEVAMSVTSTFPYSLVNNKDYNEMDDTEKFKWLEYYKIKARGYWYKELAGKLVLRAGGEFGMLGAYNQDIGIVPFERFYVGGTGLNANRFDGREIIPLRGYEDASNSGGSSTDVTPNGGATIYNKFTMELRYPITMGQQAKIYGLTFVEAGNAWGDTKEFKPFELKRSAGFGVRIFMSAFGLLGFDFGYGFDKYLNGTQPSGWQTHFIIGQQF